MADNITLDEHRLWVIFHQVYDIITRGEEEAVNEAGVTSQQFLVLMMMEFMNELSNTPIIMTEIAPNLYRSVNSISSIIDRMEKNGFIKKIRNLPDRRAIRVRVTPKGQEAFFTGLKPRNSLIKGILSVFTDEEKNTLLYLMKKFKDKAMEECHVEMGKADPAFGDQETVAHFLTKITKPEGDSK